MGSVARQASRQVSRPLAADRKGNVQCEVGFVRRGAGGCALLRLDRWTKEVVRRRELAPEIHAARQAQYLVEDQPRENSAPRRQRSHAATGPRGGGARESERSVGRRVRLASERWRAGRSSAR